MGKQMSKGQNRLNWGVQSLISRIIPIYTWHVTLNNEVHMKGISFFRNHTVKKTIKNATMYATFLEKEI